MMLENTTITLSFETAAGQGVEISYAEGPNGGQATVAVSVPGDRVAVTGAAIELLYDLQDAINADVASGWTKQLRITGYGEQASVMIADASSGLARITLVAEGVMVNADVNANERVSLDELLQRYFSELLG